MGVLDEDEIVVSGISGRLPESDNLEEFWEHLMNKDNLLTIDDRRWEPGLFGLPPRNGKLKDISRFDATFFGVHAKQANTMDPQLRILLEVAYEAIVDGGIDPQSIRGTKTGVYIGCSVSDAAESFGSDAETLVGYSVTGTNRAMLANRMSYSFDFRGPSYSVDTACSSGLMALNNAIQDIRRGDCDAAIVGASNLLVKPHSSLQFLRLGVLSPDGQSKSFDSSGNGYCRSEGVVALYITRKSVCKRAYGSLVHSGTNTDGYKEQGVTYPSGEIQQCLLRKLYSEAEINIEDVEYFEAHGTGTKVGDPEETNGIAAVFCQNRTPENPLLIGSVKSNMGHSEPTSGLAALAKVLWAFNKGVIPPNIHFKEPNPDITALLDGRMKVITEPTPYNGGYVGVSSFGFGGSNVHVIVKPFEKTTGVESAGRSPRLVLCASRTEEGVQEQISHVKKNEESAELKSLYDQIANAPLNGMPYRGFSVMGSEVQSSEVKQVSPPERRPIWYVFSGMGSQWAGMGKDLMVLKPFRDSIEYLHDVLKEEDDSMDLKGIISEGKEELLGSTINSFSAIASIHVALVNCLKAVGVEPDGMIGHSAGELGCGYADESLTAEETVLAAYWRGRCVMEAQLPPGAMAAIGLTWEETKQRVPPGVVPACHNAEDTVTISGDRESVEKFVAELQEEGIFARSVNSANVAFHSHHMTQIAPILLEALERVITNGRSASKRWVSTSITSPSDEICAPPSDMSLAAYQVNNLVSPVLFREGLAKIPENAITIEIAPHCLLQAILKRTLPSKVEFLSLMNRKKPDNLSFFLSNLGKLYASGIDVDLQGIYPATDHFPVPVSTPSIAPAIRWDHSQEWDIPRVEDFMKQGGSSPTVTKFSIDVSPESEDCYIKDHCIDGRVLYPATGYLCLAWRALARMKNTVPNQMPVEFKDVTIHQATIVPKTGTITLEVRIAPGSNSFEVGDGDQLAVSGKIFVPETPLTEKDPVGEHCIDDAGAIILEKADVYKELRLRGYEYGPDFQGIIKVKDDGKEGTLKWNGNWVSFTDTMLQVTILNRQRGIRCLRLPTRIRRIAINPALVDTEVDGTQEIKVTVDPFTDTCRAGGVEISGLHATVAPKRQVQHAAPTVEDFTFVPYNEANLQSKDSILKHYNSICSRYVHMILEVSRKKFEDAGVEFPFKDTKVNAGCVVDEDELHPFLEKLEYSYLQALQKVGQLEPKEGAASDIKEILAAGCKEDVLMRGLINGRHFKNALDVVWENTRALKMKVLEIGALSGQLYPRAISCLHSQPTTELDYNIAESDKEKMDEVLEELGTLHIKTHAWDIGMTPTNGMTGADLVLVDGLTRLTSDLDGALSNISSALKEGGFAILHDITSQPSNISMTFDHCTVTSEQEYITAFRACGFEVISMKSSGLLTSLFLCRKMTSSIPRDTSPFILNIDDDSYSWVTGLQKKMAEFEGKPLGDIIWLLSDRAYHSGIVGLTNCLKHEQGGERIRCIFNANPKNSSLDFSQLNGHMERIASQDLVMNVYKDGEWGSYRHYFLETSPDESRVETSHAYVNTLTRGDLSTLRWVASPMTYMTPEQLGKEVSICSVYYASLNFRDIMLATGKLPPDALPAELAQKECILGLEFSGRLGNGRRVMGLVQSDGLATSVAAENHLLFDVPEAWSLEDAATVPVVYCTAYYALVVRGQLRKGETILIHSGSGGVGQAAIGIALSYGCRVFTTCGTKEKRDFLKQRFLQLTDDSFANSRDLTFEPHIMRATNGRGVDMVLNSLAAEKLEASLRLLAMHGRFLEIGKYDLSQNTGLGMALFLKNTSFHGVHLDRLMDAGNPDWPTVAQLMKDGIETGVVRPLNATTFQRDDIEAAFRFMAQGKHIGKVLIQVRTEEQEKIVVPAPQKFSAITKNNCHPLRVYIITGGLGGFGLELAQWLIERGAKNLVLTSRSGVRTGYQAHRISCWQEQGIKVHISKRDISRPEDAELLIQESQQIGAIGGIFNLAMVLRDGLFENQTPETFQQCCSPKVKGTLNLDQVTRRLCGQELEWFVMFSSVSCGRGNAGQTNYGFANSSMERVCERRREDGLPGLAIQWGVIGDVGVVVDTMGGNDTVISGCVAQRMPSCLATLDCFLSQSSPVVSTAVLAERVDAARNQGAKVSLAESVAHILGLSDPRSVSQDATLSDLGLDSLMGVEVKQTLERDHSIQMGMKDLRQLTMRKLAELDSGSKPSSPTDSKDLAPAASTDADEQNQFAKVLSNSPSMLSAAAQDTVIKMNNISCPNLSPVFLLHPIEGSLSIYDEFVKQMPLPCYGVQYTPAVLNKSIPEMAAYYVDRIKEVQTHGPYRFIGLSYGACLALEMALILEASGEEVEPLISLDGAPAYLSCHTEFFQKKFAEEKTKEGKELGKDAAKDVGSLLTFAMQHTHAKWKELKEQLIDLKNYDAQFEFVTSKIMDSQPDLSREDIVYSIEGFLQRTKACLGYRPEGKHKGDIVFVKASHGSEIMSVYGLSEDYGLAEFCTGKLFTSIAEGEHGTILQGPGLATILPTVKKALNIME